MLSILFTNLTNLRQDALKEGHFPGFQKAKAECGGSGSTRRRGKPRKCVFKRSLRSGTFITTQVTPGFDAFASQNHPPSNPRNPCKLEGMQRLRRQSRSLTSPAPSDQHFSKALQPPNPKYGTGSHGSFPPHTTRARGRRPQSLLQVSRP